MCNNCKTYCHSCGAESDWRCEKCEQCVCENCTVPFTQMNNIDYTLCNNCHDSYQEEHAEEQYLDSLTPEEQKTYYKEKSIIRSVLNAVKNRLASLIN